MRGIIHAKQAYYAKPSRARQIDHAVAKPPSIPKDLVNQLLTGPMAGEAINTASLAFKQALIEASLNAELTHHLGEAAKVPPVKPMKQQTGVCPGRGEARVREARAGHQPAQRIQGHAEGRLEQRLAQLAKPKLLIVDEFGYLPFEPTAAHLLFQLVSRRYERGSILITSNRAVGDWGTVLGDQVVATAVLDRLLHHSHMLTIRGDSYRLREKRCSGLLKATPAPTSAGASQ